MAATYKGFRAATIAFVGATSRANNALKKSIRGDAAPIERDERQQDNVDGFTA
jgi:hypothetical protein